MTGFYVARFASLAITLFGAFTNFALAVQVLAARRSLKWEPESEWESSTDNWKIDGVKVIWALLSGYFASAATVCVVGFIGIVKSRPSFVRFYRDYSIADFSFCTFITAITTYAAFHTAGRAGVCEELSHHPELMRDMLEMGLNLENCERWLERAVLAFVAVMVVIIVVRLHFLLAVSTFYSYLVRHQRITALSNSYLCSYSHSHPHARQEDLSTLQRIYLLPRQFPAITSAAEDVALVYAPIPLNLLPKDIQAAATEAWVSGSDPRASRSDSSWRPFVPRSDCIPPSAQQTQEQRLHRHHRRHSHGYGHHHHHRQSSRSSSAAGRICLPILPNEGLLPSYYVLDETSQGAKA